MKKIFIITVLFCFVGCVTFKLRQPAISDLERMQQKVPTITYEDAVAGFNLYKNKCNSCHGLHRPNEFTKRAWERILPEMLHRAKVYDSIETKTLVDYLIANSK